ncbi:unnamed protein product [Oikopleura dioica]|uniref:Uncharacterized protein n=1 Tax=Oikopleura dioica TaxID=34765 RepID=E4XN33_OIKDI|nr:unnamed protein product [Oikopleura dioica]
MSLLDFFPKEGFVFIMFAAIFVSEPKDLKGLGVCVEGFCSRWLGDKRLNFVQYQINRSFATLLKGDKRWEALQYAVLPFLFTFGYVLTFIMELAISPLDRQIQRLKMVGESYYELLTKINSEMTSGNKFESDSGNIIVSTSFIVKLNPYSMEIIRKLDAQLNVLRVSEVPSTERGAEPETNMTIEVTGHMTTHGQSRFNIFVKASEMDHLVNFLGDDVQIDTQNFEINTVWDRFRAEAEKVVLRNVPLEKRECDNELEMCFACDMQAPDIRLASCVCAAMWCFSCIVRVFASHPGCKENSKIAVA